MTYEVLRNHTDYEILTEYPHTVRRHRDGRVISEWFDDKGYVKLKLNQTAYMKHRIIAEQWIVNDDPATKTQVDHINHNRSDNRISNLRWISNRDNCKNKSRHHGVEYTFITELDISNSIEVNEYNGHEFTGYYYHIDEDQFYLQTADDLYRRLHINNDRGSEFVLLNDINHKTVKVTINTFKRQHDII
ncbi:hypothetical protein M9Y10_004844 [Tritrichomonas musculus]|uniref:HNH nuclease domain-containing protein n=1 Tax=Tritrichomonas musculus TaxID=1915356 RepID=A0ABR2JKV1_9EUKA